MRLYEVACDTLAYGFLGAVLLAGCGSTSAPTAATGSSVDAAYAALVADIASCAKQLDTCDSAAADAAARGDCREVFEMCRQTSGVKAGNALASATRACTADHRECVKSERGGNQSCRDELKTCLRARPGKEHDDDDAGVDEAGKPSKKTDCLDELHTCVEAEGAADACAQSVRSCVLESLPTSDRVLPSDQDDMDEDEQSDEAGKPEQAGAGGGKAANAGKGRAHKTAARACVDSFNTCVDSGSEPRDCAQTLKECSASAKP